MISSRHRQDGLSKHAMIKDYRIENILDASDSGFRYLCEHKLHQTWHVIQEYMPVIAIRDATGQVRPGTEADLLLFKQGMSRFLELTKKLGELHHPNIIRVTERFQASGTVYSVMPFLRGTPLSNWIQTHPNPEQEALEAIFLPLLQGMAHIHNQNFLHQNINPETIFITGKGQPMLIDFGMTRLSPDPETQSRLQALTPHFSPIEQYDPKGAMSPALDIYSLAGCMYYAITHTLPVNVPERIHPDPQPKLCKTAWQDIYSPAFLSAIDKGLSLHAEDRFQTASDFQKALMEMSDAPSVRDIPSSDFERKHQPRLNGMEGYPTTEKSSDSKHTALIFGGLVFLLVALVAAGGYWFYTNGSGFLGKWGKKNNLITWLNQIPPDHVGSKADKLKTYQSLYDTDRNLVAGLFMEMEALDASDRPTALSRKWKDINQNNQIVATLAAASEDHPDVQMMLGQVYRLGLAGEKQNFSEALKWYQRAAEQNNAAAQTNLGVMYQKGQGVRQNDAEAAKWYQRAADQGSAVAQTHLGHLYQQGGGVEQSDAEAMKWFEKAAEQGYAPAQGSLGWMYQQGKGTTQNDAEAVRWFRLAADQGNADAQYNLGLACQNGSGVGQNLSEAARLYQLAASQGHAGAQNNLGRMYSMGEGVHRNDAEAVKWLQKSVDQGNADAQANLGQMYQKGQGVAQSDTEAAKLFKMAADKGIAMAQANLGRMYRDGKGVSQNDREAAKWFQMAAEQGDTNAQSSLGRMYHHGKGVPKNTTEAAKWYRMAAEKGHPGAQTNLGWMYHKGLGVFQSDLEAEKWYRLAAEQGNATAQANLGVMYEKGWGVLQNDQEAVKWLRMAAEQGDESAQNNLGLMYKNGFGINQNDEEAAKWLQRAAEQGNAVAQYNLGVMYHEGRGVVKSAANAVKWWKKAADQKNAAAQVALGVMYHEGQGVSEDTEEARKWFEKAAEQGNKDAIKILEKLKRSSRGSGRTDRR
ncbi:Sel1-like repeat-containing protein kinase family protein [Desulfosarcina sp. OttesenSCG-928-G10]|nr:Sel1-like repeat-containing protein kinase family protein [Desulfosarcina sp. OttesenSCG-928-G10]MDL2321783.1 Sel1-like repeat-containing protein kinase family protein [Desulfosarcina sp. OttesenSCG-928-B08]